MSERIPATVITGFLGAGKTSLIRHLAAQGDGRRLALLINEFGDLGVDRAIIEGCGIPGCDDEQVIELANGCICCTVADDFLPAMRRVLARQPRPDHIVVETSGLALPKPLVRAFGWPEIRTQVTVDGVIVVADAEAVLAGRFATDPQALAAQRATDPALSHEEGPLEELFEEQLACADMVLINKADRIAADGVREVEAAIAAHLRPAVRVVWTTHGRIDPRVALGLGMAVEDDLDSRPSHHDGGDEHGHDEFETFFVPLPPIGDQSELEQRLRAAALRHGILRMKGLVAVEGKPLRQVVQVVGGRVERYFDRPWRHGEQSRQGLVVIGLRGLDRPAIHAMIAGSEQPAGAAVP